MKSRIFGLDVVTRANVTQCLVYRMRKGDDVDISPVHYYRSLTDASCVRLSWILKKYFRTDIRIRPDSLVLFSWPYKDFYSSVEV